MMADYGYGAAPAQGLRRARASLRAQGARARSRQRRGLRRARHARDRKEERRNAEPRRGVQGSAARDRARSGERTGARVVRRRAARERARVATPTRELNRPRSSIRSRSQRPPGWERPPTSSAATATPSHTRARRSTSRRSAATPSRRSGSPTRRSGDRSRAAAAFTRLAEVCADCRGRGGGAARPDLRPHQPTWRRPARSSPIAQSHPRRRRARGPGAGVRRGRPARRGRRPAAPHAQRVRGGRDRQRSALRLPAQRVGVAAAPEARLDEKFSRRGLDRIILLSYCTSVLVRQFDGTRLTKGAQR